MDNKTDQLIVDFIGEIHEENIRILKRSIISKHDIAKQHKAKAIFISLKNTKYDKNSKPVTAFVNALDALSKKLEIGINFIDYSAELFAVLKLTTKNTDMKLYKNIDVARLFFDPKSFKDDLTVLVYDEDEAISIELFNELSVFAYKLTRAKDIKQFLAGINDKLYDIIVTRSSINNANKKNIKAAPAKSTLSLSKQLIVNLPIFMNKAVDTLVAFTGLEAHKVSHCIKHFDTNLKSNNICAVMPFSGDLEGYFTLVFPKDIAIVALEALLGETVQADDLATLKDGVGEFCNIITGSAKTEFDIKGIKVVFELPKTFESLDETQLQIGTNNGVWMDMQLSGKAFYMFVTNK
ncbi:MAG: chemotaxis protein CheX [Arcobacteraceae bacterium]